MNSVSVPLKHRWKRASASPSFWVIVAAMAAITLLHYLTPQVRALSAPLNAFLSRHVIERILFILPTAGATFVFGRRGGVITLLFAVLIMLPRALWLSTAPVDALLETVGTAGVGYLVVWMIEFQMKEKMLRQKTISQLNSINEVSIIVTQSLELDQILTDALDKVLQVTDLEAGLIFFLERQTQELVLAAYRGISKESATELDRIKLGEGFCGRVAESGEMMIIADSSHDPRLTRFAVRHEGLRGQIVVPLKSKDRVRGILAVATKSLRQFHPAEEELVVALGNQIGVAIENAQLYQEVARQLEIRQQLDEELQVTRSLEEANRLKAELISTLAHEMRTPLTSIKGYSTALLMDEIAFSPETQQEFLQIIDEECTVLQDLIHDLLESSIIDAGLLKLEPQPVILPRLVKDVVDDMTRRTHKHDFVVDFEAEFPIVDADPRRIEQVMRNLLDNAIKYSPDGGLIVVRGEIDQDENTAVISVADQGVGIAPEHLNRLFEKFFRVESGLGHRVVGSGLGLPIARTIVESHGGHIWAESQEGEGTTLYFAIPLEGPSAELSK